MHRRDIFNATPTTAEWSRLSWEYKNPKHKNFQSIPILRRPPASSPPSRRPRPHAPPSIPAPPPAPRRRRRRRANRTATVPATAGGQERGPDHRQDGPHGRGRRMRFKRPTPSDGHGQGRGPNARHAPSWGPAGWRRMGGVSFLVQSRASVLGCRSFRQEARKRGLD